MSEPGAFKLRKPCPKCPFRTDVAPYLHGARAVEIARSLAEGAVFWCHQTTVEDGDEGDLTSGPDSQFCAGALIVLEHEAAPNQAMRIGERLGLYDPTKLDMRAPVHRRLADFAAHHGGDALEDAPEPCAYAGEGCASPAGYLIGGVVVPPEDPGPTTECPECGEPFCEVCAADGCPFCAEWKG